MWFLTPNLSTKLGTFFKEYVFHDHTSFHQASPALSADSETDTPPADAAGDTVSSADAEYDGGEDDSDGAADIASHDAADIASEAGDASMEVAHDSDSELNAPTLQLGSQSEEDIKSVVSKAAPKDASESVHSDSEVSSESFQCSQVSSGWMGKAHNWIARQDRKAEHAANLQKLMTDLKTDLDGCDLLTDELAADYLAYAKRSVQAYGPQCYCTLASHEHIMNWVHHQKSSED